MREFINQKYVALFFFIVLIFTSACQDEYFSILESDSKYIEFTFDYNNFKTSKFAETGDNGQGYFQKGDEIGLYAFCSKPGGITKHFKLTYNGITWEPKLTAAELGTDQGLISLSAYYPYDSSIECSLENHYLHPFEVQVDQNEKKNLEKSDLLWSNEQVISSNTTGAVNFIFNHKLFRFNIDLSDINTRDLKLRVYGGKNGILNLNSMKLEFDPEENHVNDWIIPYKRPGHDKLYSVILVPQINPYKNIPKDIRIELAYLDFNGDSKSITYTVNPKDLENIDSGKDLTIRLTTIGGNQIDEKYANKKIWFHGINAPIYPESSWIILEGGVGKLAYKKEYGWYDCNKRYYIDGKTADEYQCWVAAASNMIHWWLDNNEPYTSRYIAWFNKNNKIQFPDYNFNPLTFNGGGSNIHDYISSSFADRGGFAHDAVNWFFSEIQPRQPGPGLNKAGFFKDVFADGICIYVAGMSKSRFNMYIKEAIENKLCVAYSVPGHVQNIWGVEFDQYGNVEYAYIVDNNYSDIDAEQYGGASCSRREVVYKTIEGVSQAYIATQPVSRLSLLPLKSEDFSNYVNENCN